MKKNIKVILLILNFGILFYAILWQFTEVNYEPLIVILGQTGIIIVIFSEKRLSKTSIKKISKSDISIKTSKDDDTNIDIEDVKKDSKIKIKRD